MSVNPPSKIVLSSSSKVSLHDRFTKLAKLRPVDNKPVQVRAASEKNRKLAEQMAARPSVKAALNPRKPPPPKRVSLNQRLGTGNRISSARPGVPNKRPLQTRLGPPARKVPVQARLSVVKPAMPAKGKVARVGPKGGIGLKNRVKYLKQNSLKQKLKKPGVKATVVKKGKAGKPEAKKPADPKALDMDLDKYMSKTKGHLNNDLDKYMSKSKGFLDNDLDTYMAQTN